MWGLGCGESGLGTLNIGMGSGQNYELLPRGREVLGSELEPEMIPDLWLSSATFSVQLPGTLTPPQSAFGDVAEWRSQPPPLPS